MSALGRWLIDQLADTRRPALADLCARMAHTLAQPPSCSDDARVGSHRTHEAGPAHPLRRKNDRDEYIDPPPPAWATAAGCSLRLLHNAHAAHQVSTSRAEAGESSARLVVRRRARTTKRAIVTPIRRTA